MRAPALLRIVSYLACASGLLVMVACFAQRKLIYFPKRESEESALSQAKHLGLEPWRDTAGTLVGWKAPHPTQPAAANLLVLHGNAGSALGRTYLAAAFQGPQVAMPLDVFLLEYPGYGPRQGSPSEAKLVGETLRLIQLLQSTRKPLLLCGESLGAATACLATAQRPDAVKGIILLVPLKNLREVGKRHYPWFPTWLLRDTFQAEMALKAYPGPWQD